MKASYIAFLLLLVGSNSTSADVRPLHLHYKIMQPVDVFLKIELSREVSRPPVTEVGARLVKW